MAHLLKKSYLTYIFLLLYVVLLGLGLSHHEFWMDESHHWLIARDSNSIADLINNYRYDGHPILWVSCLWVIGQFTSKVIFVQIFHAFIATLIAIIILFKSPFKRQYNLLFIFGYYPLFEYGVLSRNYALTVLFLLLFCVSFKKGGKLLLPFLFLGLVSNSHLFGLILSVILGLRILYDKRSELKSHLAPMALFLLMVVFAFITIKAPSDHYFYLDTSKIFDFQKLKSILSVWWKAILPIPNFLELHFWNTNFFTSNFKIISIPFVLLSWCIPLFVLKRKSGYYLVFYAYALSVLAFCLLTGLNVSQRIGGYLLFSLVVIVWLEKKQMTNNLFIIHLKESTKKPLLFVFLSIQILAAGLLLATDVARPFSNTKQIYHFMVDNFENETPVYGGLYCNYIGVNNYGDLKLQLTSQQNETKYCDWRVLTKNKHKASLEEAMQLMSAKGYKEMIYLTPHQLLDSDVIPYQIQLIGQKTDAMVKNENAYIYLFSRK